MKTKIFLFLLLVLLTQSAFSQSFIAENKQWNIGLCINGGFGCNYYTRIYRFNGDTLVHGTSYAKLYESYDNEMKKRVLYSMYRETEDKQIYRIEPNDYDEYLQYDFTLQQGDSIKLAGTWSKVDSVCIKKLGSELRTHWYITTIHDHKARQSIWIEGIGSLMGLIRPVDSGQVGAELFLVCFSENGEQVYQNPDFSGCYIKQPAYTNPVESKKQLMELYTSENGQLNLQLFNEAKGILFLYTPDGKQLMKMPVKQSVSTFCAPANGLLLYRYVNGKGEVQTGKILVE